MKGRTSFWPYLTLLLVAVAFSCTIQYLGLTEVFTRGREGLFLAVVLLLGMAYVIGHLPHTAVPGLVWAMLVGMALQLPLLGLVTHRDTLLFTVELFAAFILFASGVAVPIKQFKKHFASIATLSLAGTILTVFLFAYALFWLTSAFGLAVPVTAIIVLSAILASTDPSTIIPLLDHLHVRKPFLRDIAVSEGAVNDVVGAVLTRFFLFAALGASAGAVTLGDGFAPLHAQGALASLSLEVVWGILVGLLGAWILKVWGESVRRTHWSDSALFVVVPLFCFALGSLAGGAGFLAAFVCGLLFEPRQETHEARRVLHLTIERYLTPAIFVLFGALIPMGLLVSNLALGVASALIFMFVIRPLVVFVTLLPWMHAKNDLLSWRESLFLSFMHEAGAVSAVLVLYAGVVGLVASDFVFAVGAWVIIITFIIEPLLVPLVAKRLDK